MDFDQKRTIILGSNGIGKSNLLESVEFLSQLKSNRAANDKDLINKLSDYSTITAQVDFNNELLIELHRRGSKKVFINSRLQKKQSNVRNYIRSVCFSSDDICIVRGEPSFRRTWIDKVVSQLEPVYTELLSRFSKLLRQRSSYWKSPNFKNNTNKTLIDSFDAQMALVGTRILRRRRRALFKLKPYIEYWHNHLSKSKESIDLDYICSLHISEEKDDEKEIMALFEAQLFQQRNLEELTGKCSIGPHRDDIDFFINNSLVKKFGSSGQQRTITLALKMAELDLLRNTINVNPILILDDVLAELDVTRQNLLLNSVGDKSQCMISATHLNKFHKSFLDNSQIIHL